MNHHRSLLSAIFPLRLAETSLGFSQKHSCLKRQQSVMRTKPVIKHLRAYVARIGVCPAGKMPDQLKAEATRLNAEHGNSR